MNFHVHISYYLGLIETRPRHLDFFFHVILTGLVESMLPRLLLLLS